MNQLVPITTNADAYRASTDAAQLCKDIVTATASNIQGKRYVSVEGWEAIARAHGCAAGARDVERVDGGVRATGEVRDMFTGNIIATAEGFVGEDEPTWYGGQSRGKTLPKRPDYAIRAMAQTRAISRACRSAFAHVVVMMNAGLATTPAEEVPFEGFDNGAEPKIAGIHKIKERLRILQTEGDKATTLDDFNASVHVSKADLEQIKHNNHGWWTGDGEDFEGFKSWIMRRRAELAPHIADRMAALAEQPEDDGQFKMLVDSMKQTETLQALTNWMAANEPIIEQLDGAESRKFELAFNLHESAILEVAKATAG